MQDYLSILGYVVKIDCDRYLEDLGMEEFDSSSTIRYAKWFENESLALAAAVYVKAIYYAETGKECYPKVYAIYACDINIVNRED